MGENIREGGRDARGVNTELYGFRPIDVGIFHSVMGFLLSINTNN